MTTQPPPTQYFNNIIFNPNFWNQTTAGITQAQADALYLARTGTPTSIASLTSFSGDITTNTTATVGTDLTLTNRNKLSSVKTVSGTTTLVSGDSEYINIVPTSSTAFTITLPRCDVSTKIGTKFSFFFTDTSNFYPVITIRVNNTAIERIYDTYFSDTSITISSIASVNTIELVCTAIKASSPSAVVWSTNTIAPDYSLFAYVNVSNTFNDTNDFTATTTFTGGITGTGTQTIDFGTNAPTMAGTNVSGVVKTSGNESILGTKTFADIVSTTINAITTLSIGGVSLYSIFLTTSNAVNDYARLAYNNTFLGTTLFQYYIPTINSSLYPTTNYQLSPKIYVDDSFAFVFAGSPRSFLNQISFTNYAPQTVVDPVSPLDLVNKGYIDNYVIGSSAISNTWVSTNEFTTALRTTVTAVASSDVINKSYADSNLSNSALLSATNTFTGTNEFTTALRTSVSAVASTDVINKSYADSNLSNSALLSSANTFTGTNNFTTALRTTVSAVASTDVINKSYADSNLSNSALLSSANTFTGTNNFTTALRTTVSAVASTDVINKSYADSNLSNSALLSATNTFTGTSNTFNGDFTVNCAVTTGTILLQYNSVTMIEIARYALYSPISISPDFSQITFNYAPVFRTSFYLDNNITMYVGSVYAPATLAIFDGTLSVSTTNGSFLTNTIEPTDTATNCTVYSTSTATVNVGNASASMVSTFSNNTYDKITLNGRNNLFSIDTVRTTAFTISSPFFHIYPVNPTSNLVITLPTAGLSNLGTTFTIRRVGGTASTTITSASSNIYPFTSFTAGNGILVGNAYTTTIVCAYVNNTPTYGWFKIV